MTLLEQPEPYRILVLAPFPPRRDATHGGGRVLGQMIAHLASRHQVALVYMRAPDDPPIEDAIRDLCTVCEPIARRGVSSHVSGRMFRRMRILLGLLRGHPMQITDWFVTDLDRQIRELVRMWQPDVVQAEFQLMGQYLPALADTHVPRILVDYDPGAQAAHERAQQMHGFARLLERVDAWAWRRQEASTMRHADVVVTFTERDRQALARVANGQPLVCIPFGMQLPNQALDPVGDLPPRLLYVGSFVHAPNVDAAERLANTIGPAVRARRPDVWVDIVGDQPPVQLQRKSGDGLLVTGRVPDVTRYMERAALVVVPIRLGGGMRVKILEALAAGKAVVATRRAVEGLDLVDGREIVLAETDAEFCDAIVELLDDSTRRAEIGAQAHAWARRSLSWERVLEEYEHLYAQLVQHAPIAAHP